MRWFFHSTHIAPLGCRVQGSPLEPDQEDQFAAGPIVYVLYESTRERDELLNRLRRAGLGQVPRLLVNVGTPGVNSSRLRMRLHRWSRVAEVLGAGALAVVGFLSSRWILLVVAILAAGPLFVLWRLMRGVAQPGCNPSLADYAHSRSPSAAYPAEVRRRSG